MAFSGWYPSSFIQMPFSGIEIDYVVWPWHVGDLYYEVSGIEKTLGFMPIIQNSLTSQTFPSLTERISGIETGYILRVGTPSSNQLAIWNSASSITNNTLWSVGTDIRPVTSGNGLLGTPTFWIDSGYFNSLVTNEIVLGGIHYTSIGGTGDVTGPSASLDNEIPRFDGTTGKAIQSGSKWTIDDFGNMKPANSGVQDIGSQTNPLSGIFSNQYATSLFTHSSSASSISINWNNGASQNINFNPGYSGNVNLTLSNPIAGSFYTLTTIQNPSGTTNINFPASVKWQGGISGVMTASGNAIDMFSLYYNGNNYLGAYSSNYI